MTATVSIDSAGARGAATQRAGAYRYIKRGLDIGASIVVTVVMAVPVAATCVAICLESPGTPVFCHERVGKGGRRIGVFKLRTMYIDAEENMRDYLSPAQIAQWESEHKVDNDPRVTKIGRFLRKTSLDELPQFLNVLAGQMSVVGPRPVTAAELGHFGDDLPEVLSVRPGITGFWQAYARNDATWESGKRQRMELYYVRNISAGLDARIFFRSFGAIFGLTGK